MRILKSLLARLRTRRAFGLVGLGAGIVLIGWLHHAGRAVPVHYLVPAGIERLELTYRADGASFNRTELRAGPSQHWTHEVRLLGGPIHVDLALAAGAARWTTGFELQTSGTATTVDVCALFRERPEPCRAR